jgi:hypothetical protein
MPDPAILDEGGGFADGEVERVGPLIVHYLYELI